MTDSRRRQLSDVVKIGMGCNCSKRLFAWKKKQCGMALGDYAKSLENRRLELLRIMDEKEDCDYGEELINEWIELTKERNEVVHKVFVEESRAFIEHSLLQAHFWLERALKEPNCPLVLPSPLLSDLSSSLTSVHSHLLSRNIPLDSRESSLEPPALSLSPVPNGNSVHSSSPEADRHRERDYRLQGSSPLGLKERARAVSEGPIKSPVSEDDYLTTRDDRSMASLDTFDSAWSVGQMSKNLGGQFFPSAFSHQFMVAQRLSTPVADESIQEEEQPDESID